MFVLWPMPEHLVNYKGKLKVGTSTRHDLGDQLHCRTLNPRPDIARAAPSPFQLGTSKNLPPRDRVEPPRPSHELPR